MYYFIILQNSYIHVTIPRGGHGEVSEHLSETITFIRKPSTYRHDTYIDPSTLLAAIQTKLVSTYVLLFKVTLMI